jgi:hypothetical protein
MPRGKTTVSGIGQADLTYAVNRLIALGKTNAREITGLAAERPMRIAALEKELSSLRTGASPASSNGAAARTATAARAAAPAPTTRKKRKFTMTPKALKARKLQGRYLGLLRKLDAKQRAQCSKAAKKGGVLAGLKVAEKLVRA